MIILNHYVVITELYTKNYLKSQEKLLMFATIALSVLKSSNLKIVSILVLQRKFSDCELQTIQLKKSIS